MDYLMLGNQEFPTQASTLETIDTGFFEYVRDKFDIHTVSNGGFVKVPVIWTGQERAFQLKSDQNLRDSVDEKLEPELAQSVKDAISQITGMLN